MALKMALNMAQYGHYWSYPSYSEAPFVGTLNLCQEVPDTMTNKLGHLHHPILRKRTKYCKNINDFLYFGMQSGRGGLVPILWFWSSALSEFY